MKRSISTTDIPAARTWGGRTLLPHEEMLMFFDKTGPVQETFQRLKENLQAEGIDYVVIGAFALGAHKFERATMDVDLCIRRDDLERFRRRFVGGVYQSVEGTSRRFYDPLTKVTFDLLISGELAGRVSRNKSIRFPDPADATEISGLRTVDLVRLVELKLVTWRLKDWADVIALIRANQLDEQFADKLDPLVRMAYLECYDQMKEEDMYDRERDEL